LIGLRRAIGLSLCNLYSNAANQGAIVALFRVVKHFYNTSNKIGR
jgi:hypothetical protein